MEERVSTPDVTHLQQGVYKNFPKTGENHRNTRLVCKNQKLFVLSQTSLYSIDMPLLRGQTL
jgi:hypothetical protein